MHNFFSNSIFLQVPAQIFVPFSFFLICVIVFLIKRLFSVQNFPFSVKSISESIIFSNIVLVLHFYYKFYNDNPLFFELTNFKVFVSSVAA